MLIWLPLGRWLPQIFPFRPGGSSLRESPSGQECVKLLGGTNDVRRHDLERRLINRHTVLLPPEDFRLEKTIALLLRQQF